MQLDIKLCKKSPSSGGWSREQADAVARQYGLDPTQFRSKSALCDALLEILQPPAPEVPAWTNQALAGQFMSLSQLYRRKGDEIRAGAFMKAADVLNRWPTLITNPNELKTAPGIGSGSIDRLRELFRTGQLAELEVEERVRKELSQVYGVGPATADKLIDLGVTSLADLQQKVQAGTIHLNDNQRIGLEYVEDFKQRIPRAEVKHIGDYIIQVIQTLAPGNQAEIVGSYRRGRPDSGDIDILFTGQNVLKDVVNYLQQIGLLYHNFAHGEVSLHSTYWNGYPQQRGILRKIDIRYVPPESWATALLHSTGSDRFNVNLRNRALSMNMTLSEHGIYTFDPITRQKGTAIPVQSEEDIFRLLGIPYVPPEQRSI